MLIPVFFPFANFEKKEKNISNIFLKYICSFQIKNSIQFSSLSGNSFSTYLHNICTFFFFFFETGVKILKKII